MCVCRTLDVYGSREYRAANRLAKMRRMPYLSRSLSAKEPYKWWLFCGNLWHPMHLDRPVSCIMVEGSPAVLHDTFSTHTHMTHSQHTHTWHILNTHTHDTFSTHTHDTFSTHTHMTHSQHTHTRHILNTHTVCAMTHSQDTLWYVFKTHSQHTHTWHTHNAHTACAMTHTIVRLHHTLSTHTL